MDFPNREDKAFKVGLKLLIYHVYCIVHVRIITDRIITINLMRVVYFYRGKLFTALIFYLMFGTNLVRLVQNKECIGVLYKSDDILKLKKVFVKTLAPATIEKYLNMPVLSCCY